MGEFLEWHQTPHPPLRQAVPSPQSAKRDESVTMRDESAAGSTECLEFRSERRPGHVIGFLLLFLLVAKGGSHRGNVAGDCMIE